jgi:ABC-type multidrug transport system ATPase subunit
MVCDKVAIIKQGVMLTSSTVQELTSHGQQLHVKVENESAALAALKNQPWIKSVKTENGYIIIDAPKDSASRVNEVLAENKLFASELVNKSASLEDVFLQLTGGNAGD